MIALKICHFANLDFPISYLSLCVCLFCAHTPLRGHLAQGGDGDFHFSLNYRKHYFLNLYEILKK